MRLETVARCGEGDPVSSRSYETFLSEYRGSGPLRDVTVLDFTQMMMGPVATQLMGDLGALVVKVEPPGKGEFERSCITRGRRFEDESPHFLSVNRNKVSLALDLKDAGGRETVLRLVQHCDVVVNNFRPGVMERLGLGHDELKTRNPAVVFGQGSGWGPSGDFAGRPGQDLLVQAMSGLAANSGSRDGPPVAAATAFCDAAGGFLLAFALISAVHEARLTGTGRRVDVSLLGTALLVQAIEAFMAMNMSDMILTRSTSGIAAPWLEAPYGFYATSDGWVAVSMMPREKFIKLFSLDPSLLLLNHDEWYEERDRVNDQLKDVIAQRTTREWLDTFAEHDAWAAPLLTLGEAVRHPQVKANGYVETFELGHDRGDADAIGLVTPMTDLTSARRLPPPLLGEHNEVILEALRMGDHESSAAGVAVGRG
jgi:crotonobetainyl-CoA:carnitine CoA-transferase CaiB-like acyl-CoA transferase